MYKKIQKENLITKFTINFVLNKENFKTFYTNSLCKKVIASRLLKKRKQNKICEHFFVVEGKLVKLLSINNNRIIMIKLIFTKNYIKLIDILYIKLIIENR